MSVHEYSPEEALVTLMQSVRRIDAQLADHIQSVIDAGKDIDEVEPTRDRRRRTRSYRKTVPHSFEDALQIALVSLRAYFIEQPLFVDSCLAEMSKSFLEAPVIDRHSFVLYNEQKVSVDPESQGQDKVIEIEVRTVTQISQPSVETRRFERVSAAQLQQQQVNFRRLCDLLDFEG
jgi:hypothetical protein